MIEDYSLLQLTIEADKLAALSGLASRMAKLRRPGTRYLAGLWSNSLEQDLLWVNSDAMSQELESRDNHPTEWRAPSWSWASIDSHIVFTNRLVKTYFTIHDAQTQLATTDRTGRVKDGSITLTAKVFLSTVVLQVEDKKTTWVLSIDGTEESFREDEERNQLHLDFPPDPFGVGQKLIPSTGKVLCIRMARSSAMFNIQVGDLEELEEVDDDLDDVEEMLLSKKSQEREEVTRVGKVEETEYALVVYSTVASPTEFKRIGMITHARRSVLPENISTPSRMWRDKPCIFETGGSEESITIR
jgi:hypothetical protein